MKALSSQDYRLQISQIYKLFTRHSLVRLYAQYLLNITNAGLLSAYLGSGSSGGSGTTYTGTNAIPLNTWVRVGLTKAGSTITGYINQTPEFTGTTPVMGVANQPLVIGGEVGGSAYNFIGYMQELRLTPAYARDLTVAQTQPFPDA